MPEADLTQACLKIQGQSQGQEQGGVAALLHESHPWP